MTAQAPPRQDVARALELVPEVWQLEHVCVCIYIYIYIYLFFFNARVSLNYYFDSPNWLITTFFFSTFFFFSAFFTCVIMLYMSVLKTMYYVHVWNKTCSVLIVKYLKELVISLYYVTVCKPRCIQCVKHLTIQTICKYLYKFTSLLELSRVHMHNYVTTL